LEETPTGSCRTPDDQQPRVQLKKEFAAGHIVSGNNEDKAFAKKYAVSEKLVKEYLQHLELLEYKKEKRSQQRAHDKQSHQYNEEDWDKFYAARKLKTVLVKDLDTYMENNY
jgi:hypothetical protein